MKEIPIVVDIENREREARANLVKWFPDLKDKEPTDLVISILDSLDEAGQNLCRDNNIPSQVFEFNFKIYADALKSILPTDAYTRFCNWRG